MSDETISFGYVMLKESVAAIPQWDAFLKAKADALHKQAETLIDTMSDAEEVLLPEGNESNLPLPPSEEEASELKLPWETTPAPPVAGDEAISRLAE